MVQKKIRKGVVVFCTLFMTSPVFSSKLSSHFNIPVTKYKLDNGMTILLNPDKNSSICSYLLGVATGSRHEKNGITGISHMFEHLMFKGTTKYPNFDKVHAENGIIQTNAFTSRDYTAYVSAFPCDKLDLILDLESDRLVNLTLTQDELDKERQAVQEERLISIDNSPTGQLLEAFFDTVYKKHNYRWPILGYSKDIAAYTLEDLRTWYKTYYSPNNATLVLSGDFSESKAKQKIEKYFGALESKDIPKEVIIKEPEQTKTRFRSVESDGESSYVAMGFKIGSSGTKEHLALDVLVDLLGTGESSRLYTKLVREKKLSPHISVGTMGLLQENLFYIFYQLSDKSKEQEIKTVIKEEIEKILTQPISDRELGKIKNMQMSRLVSQLKSNKSKVRALSDYEILYKDYTKIYSDIDDTSDLSSDYIQQVGKKYLDFEKMSYVTLESKKKGDE